jgi:3D (Asp-Asp-Asp) domain-containing protein
MKKLLNLKNIAIGLLIVIVVFQQCGGNKKTTGEIVKVDGKKYELIKHEIDTFEIVKTKVVTKRGEDIYHETIVEKEVIIPNVGLVKAVDTGSAVKDKVASGGKLPVIDVFFVNKSDAIDFADSHPKIVKVAVLN